MQNPKTIVLYGASWCNECRRTKKYLDEHSIPYVYVNMEEHPSAADEVTKLTNGYQSIPTLHFPSGAVLIEPTDEELEAKIKAED